jgi:hypothetical protein
LSRLNTLQLLDFMDCENIRDLTPLSSLTSLQYLFFDTHPRSIIGGRIHQQALDVSPLSCLTNLVPAFRSGVQGYSLPGS